MGYFVSSSYRYDLQLIFWRATEKRIGAKLQKMIFFQLRSWPDQDESTKCGTWFFRQEAQLVSPQKFSESEVPNGISLQFFGTHFYMDLFSSLEPIFIYFCTTEELLFIFVPQRNLAV